MIVKIWSTHVDTHTEEPETTLHLSEDDALTSLVEVAEGYYPEGSVSKHGVIGKLARRGILATLSGHEIDVNP